MTGPEAWGWDSRDDKDVRIYAEQAELEGFSRVALPQGLVSSGFFANVVLLPFDEALRAAIGTEIVSGILLVDVCRYVDDLRVLIAIEPNSDHSSKELKETVSEWLNQVLEETSRSLELSPKKTQIVALGRDERPLVKQSAKMNRIQSAVSGGFDALGGEEILNGIRGLMRSQEALSEEDDNGWRLSPVPDVRDETVARFGAARYRTTFRSIRPLLDDDTLDELLLEISDTKPGGRLRFARTRRELDEDARAFALSLIQRWIDDPSNVRLLRIGLDLWPDVELLREVLALLRPFTRKGGRRKVPDLGAEGGDMPLNRRSTILCGCILACCYTAVLLSAGSAYAVCVSQTVGNTTIHNCDGKISVSQTVGGTTVHTIDGKIGVSQTVGATTVHNVDGKLGTSQTVGTTTIHNIDGEFGMLQKIGNTTVYSGPLFDGR